MAVYDVAKQLIAISPDIPDETAQVLDQHKDPARLGDIVAATVDLSPEERASLLVEVDVAERLRRLLGAAAAQGASSSRSSRRSTRRCARSSRKHQREAVLRQKLKAIQDELGEGEDASDLDAFEEKIKAAEMPAEVEKTARKQLERLKQMAQSSAEYTVQRTYLEWLVELPWSKRTEDRLDLDQAREILDADHYDLKKVKKRILEYLAVRKLAPGKKGPILCLAGPPGVGKTSLGKSIARSLGREFIRISLGGVRDEAEVRGHRRTYIGALPGPHHPGHAAGRARSNPVFMLDEIDKLGADFRGDPSAALLEVLDPEQNSTFSDHYLEVTFDLSDVIFIATANMLDPIPPALLDRMEVLEIPGYTREEKLEIAKRHLVPKQVAEHGLDDRADQALRRGARRRSSSSTRARRACATSSARSPASSAAIAVKVAGEPALRSQPDRRRRIADILGPQKFYSEAAERTEIPGVATGLAWTPTGGDILFIEVSRDARQGEPDPHRPARRRDEGVGARGPLVGAHARRGARHHHRLREDGHPPARARRAPCRRTGRRRASPSPSALVSLLTGRRVRGDVAMTGEITLRGTVLPVGGIKEKVLAAHRAGIKRVVLPERNRKDIVDIPETVRAELEHRLRQEDRRGAGADARDGAGGGPRPRRHRRRAPKSPPAPEPR